MLKKKNRTNFSFFLLTLAIINIKSAHSTDGSFDPETSFDLNRSQKRQSKRHITDSFECDHGVTGLFPHPLDCGKFLQCDNGKTYTVDCSPGTVFNDQTNNCDWAWKTQCGSRQIYVKTATATRIPPIPTRQSIPPISSHPQTTEEDETNTGEGLINIRIARAALHPQTDDWDPKEYNSFISETISRVDRPKRQATESIKCTNGATGLFSHPSDCSKFLQCDKGRTFIMDCFTGTVFNDVTKICDWPRKTNCGSRKLNVNGATHPTTQAYDRVQNQRNNPRQHQQPHYHQQSQNRNDQRSRSSPHLIRGQTQNQVNPPDQRPAQNSGQNRFNEFAPSQTDEISTRALDQSQPNVEIVSLQNQFPEVNVMSKRVGGEFLKYFSKETHAKTPEKAQKRPIILKITPQQFLDTNLVSERVGNEFNVYFVNPKSNPEVTFRLSPGTESRTKQKPAPIDYITLVQQGTPYVHSASPQFPQINLMSPTVGNEFYRYFSHVKPKSTPKKSATESQRITEEIVPVVEIDEQSMKNDEQNEPQVPPSKGLFHGQPELNRKISSPLDNYNRLYYKPTTKPFGQNTNERNDGTANVLISDNLKLLLQPYFNEKASKATTKSKSADTAVVPRIPSNSADEEIFTTTPRPRPRPSFRPPSRLPESSATRKPPTYHRSGPPDPNKIYFPGPHSQSHPMHY